MDLQRLLAHNHWFTLGTGTYRVRLCARCSGTVAGFFLFLLAFRNANLESFHGFSTLQQFSLSFLMGLPSAVDWLTQTWGFKESTNRRRVAFGFLVGTGAGLLSLSSLPGFLRTLSLAASAFTVIAAGYLGRWLLRMRATSYLVH